MRGLDALAAACAPQDTTPTGAPGFIALSDEQCQKIANQVLQQLQGGQQKPEAEDQAGDLEDPADPAEEEGEEANAGEYFS